MKGVQTHVIGPLNLWQYYVIDVAAEKEAFTKAWRDDQSASRIVRSLGNDELSGSSLAEAFTLLERHALRNRMALSDRYATHLDTPVAVAILRALAENDAKGEAEALDAFAKAMDSLNASLYALYDDDVKAIMENLSGRMAFMRLDANGPKMGVITKE